MVEFVLRRRLGDTGVVARALVEGEGFIGWAARGRYTRRLGGQPEMVENGPDRGRLGDEGDEFHGVPTIWTHCCISDYFTGNFQNYLACKKVAFLTLIAPVVQSWQVA